MTETIGERRAETAKENDDSDIIEAANEESLSAPSQLGSGGGNLQRDLATQAEERRVEDPEGHESVNKGDHMAHGQHSDEPRPATDVVSEG